VIAISNGNPYFIGNSRDAAYDFFYEKETKTQLTKETNPGIGNVTYTKPIPGFF
jgi:hypothetical protein